MDVPSTPTSSCVSTRPPTIAVLTSGGDAPGMNAAVRAVIRQGLDRGAKVYAVCEGYEGLVLGGDRIRASNWDDVAGILHKGGTIIGTARCAEFRTKEGRQAAALNIIQHNIDTLVVIGGDGSLTGADVLRNEWQEQMQDLLKNGKIEADVYDRYASGIKVVGLVGSIDNDVVGTEFTIGSDTALHRITEAIDAILSTAVSHKRSFIVEVMGRNCGYLALVAALVTGADYVLFPECPPAKDWETHMCQILDRGRSQGRRFSLVIIAEGAIDKEGRPISSNYVKKVLEEKLGHDTRVTILGHVQRGGTPTVFDRNISTLMGAAAVDAAFDMGNESILIGIQGNNITRLPLMEYVEKTKEVARFIERKEFNKAMESRGKSFCEAYQIYTTLSRVTPHTPSPDQPRIRIAVMNSGAASPGMNTAVRAIVRLGVDRGHVMLGVHNGFPGLISNSVEQMEWMTVNGWAVMGGALLGTNRKTATTDEQLQAIAKTIEKNQIQALVMIGGHEGYVGILQLYHNRHKYPALNIPYICVPATISNNLPATDFTVGADTSLNNIVHAIDLIKQSAVASRRVFAIEVMGSNCGYLAVMASLAGGAEKIYLNETGISLGLLQRDLEDLKERFSDSTKQKLGLIVRNENANPVYTTDFICKLLKEENQGIFDVRESILGHLQQGGNPSPLDRLYATRLVAPAFDFIENQLAKGSRESVAFGLRGSDVILTPLDVAESMMDRNARRPKEQWWMRILKLANTLAQNGPSKPTPAGPRRTWTMARFNF